MEFINFEAEKVQNRDSSPLNHSIQTADDNHGMQLWNDKQHSTVDGTVFAQGSIVFFKYTKKLRTEKIDLTAIEDLELNGGDRLSKTKQEHFNCTEINELDMITREKQNARVN